MQCSDLEFSSFKPLELKIHGDNDPLIQRDSCDHVPPAAVGSQIVIVIFLAFVVWAFRR